MTQVREISRLIRASLLLGLVLGEQEVIVIRGNDEGDLVARDDNLEVIFYAEGGCSVFVFCAETMPPCGYHCGSCPEEAERTWRHCPVADQCPYLLTSEVVVDSTDFINEGSHSQLEAKVSRMF
jgi:hypothetical protein